jgi:T-complex protein 1 subunit gamma
LLLEWLEEVLKIIKHISVPIDTANDDEMLALVKTSIGTKFAMRWSDLMCKLASEAMHVMAQDDGGVKTVDIKRYASVEMRPGVRSS